MSRGVASLKPRVILMLAWLLIANAARAAGQEPVATPAPDGFEFLPRTEFHLSLAWLGATTLTPTPDKPPEDQRYSWDSYWGGWVDVLDYVAGRLSVYLDYEAVLGSEYQPFDPNQGNYTLEGSSSFRLGPTTEVAMIFHHVSRHLSDRAKPKEPIAFNELGGRLLQRLSAGKWTVDIDVEGGHVAQHSYVDYTWLGDAQVRANVPLSERVAFFAHGAGHTIGVDHSVPNRTTQFGGLLEAGVRINGTKGAMELFAGGEKRIDAYPLDREPRRWMLVGMRLLSR